MSDNRSTEINIISEALAKAQGSYLPLVANQDGPHGKYANLAAVLDSARKALSENSLAFSQNIELKDEGSGQSILKTVLSHASGQWMSSTARIVPGKTFRETFNCVEAYRRLNALLLLGIAPHDNDPLIKDDNGYEQSNTVILESLRTQNPNLVKPSEHADVISIAQYEDLMMELEGYEEIAKGIQNAYGISSISDLPKDQYYIVQNRVRTLKKDHEDWKRNKR